MPWEAIAVGWYDGPRQALGVFSYTALWHMPGLPPVEIRDVLVCDPKGHLRIKAFICTDLQAVALHSTVEECTGHKHGVQRYAFLACSPAIPGKEHQPGAHDPMLLEPGMSCQRPGRPGP
jgi:hypothetical protein